MLTAASVSSWPFHRPNCVARYFLQQLLEGVRDRGGVLERLAWLPIGPIENGRRRGNAGRCCSVANCYFYKGEQRSLRVVLGHFGHFPCCLPDFASLSTRSWAGATPGHRNWFL